MEWCHAALRAQDLRGHSDDGYARGDVFNNHRPRPNDGTGPDADSLPNCRSGPNVGSATDADASGQRRIAGNVRVILKNAVMLYHRCSIHNRIITQHNFGINNTSSKYL